MTNKFNTALQDIFEGREENFSGHLLQLLHALYERGVADGPSGAAVRGRTPALQAPRVAVGEVVPTVGHLREGDLFQNDYLKSRGQKRHVTHVEIQKNRNVVLTTDLWDADGSIRLPDERIDQDRFHTYAPYKRVD